MKVLIIEDEVLAAERLESLLEDILPNVEILARLCTISDSVAWLKQNSAELVFLDINLADGLSFSIFEQVKLDTPVIFTTAYDEYSIKAFELNSISYLLKPIKRKDLIFSIQKFNNLKASFSYDLENLILAYKRLKPDFRKRFLIQIGTKVMMVNAKDIAYFFSFEKGVYLKTFDKRSYPLELSLDMIEKQINPEQFFRINRRYIVNIDSIHGMVTWSIRRIKIFLRPEPDDNNDIVVSVGRSSYFKKWLNK